MKYIMPILETERLMLKRGTYEDFVKVYEYDFTKLRDIDGICTFEKLNPKFIEGFDTYIDTEENVLDFIVYLKDKMIPTGNLTLDRYDDKLKSLEISINIHPKYWHKGYGKEAILEVMDYVFNNLDIENIIYGYAEENIKSKGLNDKIGFEYLNDSIEYYPQIKKDVKVIHTIMSKNNYEEKYQHQKNIDKIKRRLFI